MAVLATSQIMQWLIEGERCLAIGREIHDKLHFLEAGPRVLGEWVMKGIGC